MFSNSQINLLNSQARHAELLRQAEQAALAREARCHSRRTVGPIAQFGAALENLGHRLQEREA